MNQVLIVNHRLGRTIRIPAKDLKTYLAAGWQRVRQPDQPTHRQMKAGPAPAIPKNYMTR